MISVRGELEIAALFEFGQVGNGSGYGGCENALCFLGKEDLGVVVDSLLLGELV